MRCRSIPLLAAFFVIFFGIYLINAGDLNPKNPPAATMKSLDEIQPGIAIRGSGIPSDTILINQSGSYYLLENIQFSSTGIKIEADNVSVDLMGYTISGSETGFGYGIEISGSNVKVSNGTIEKFPQHGINVSSFPVGVIIESVIVISNKFNGISASGGHITIHNCIACENGLFGISASHDSTVSDSKSYKNKGAGISVSARCMVRNNLVYKNGSSQVPEEMAPGIGSSEYCTLSDNIVSDNYYTGIVTGDKCTLVNNKSMNNGRDGLKAGKYNQLINNSSSDNKGDGVFVSSHGNVNSNCAHNNTGDGIEVEDGCNIWGNNSSNNGKMGIETGDLCMVDRNIALENNKSGQGYENLRRRETCTYSLNHAP